jgi:hypothetical protein
MTVWQIKLDTLVSTFSNAGRGEFSGSVPDGGPPRQKRNLEVNGSQRRASFRQGNFTAAHLEVDVACGAITACNFT